MDADALLFGAGYLQSFAIGQPSLAHALQQMIGIFVEKIKGPLESA
jgi:hypothetical protein